jgi:hypothetical protein
MRTVIVRVFEPAPGTGEVELRGFVDDVTRGTSERFTGTVELLTALQRIVSPFAAPHPLGSPATPSEAGA